MQSCLELSLGIPDRAAEKAQYLANPSVRAAIVRQDYREGLQTYLMQR